MDELPAAAYSQRKYLVVSKPRLAEERIRAILIIGCDLHTRYQVIAQLNSETGELVTRRLQHENGEAGAFYASLPAPAQVGIEATGYTQWFERLMAELN